MSDYVDDFLLTAAICDYYYTYPSCPSAGEFLGRAVIDISERAAHLWLPRPYSLEDFEDAVQRAALKAMKYLSIPPGTRRGAFDPSRGSAFSYITRICRCSHSNHGRDERVRCKHRAVLDPETADTVLQGRTDKFHKNLAVNLDSGIH